MSKEAEMNLALRKVYDLAWSKTLSQLPRYQGLSNPHFISVPRAFGSARYRLMVVGQQTHWWPQGRVFLEGLGDDPVGAILKLYADFNCAENYSGSDSPFWTANNQLYEKLNPGGEQGGFVWSNIVKIDQRQQRPAPDIEEKVSGARMLQQEIAISAPDVVVFFTGPEYESRLKASFPGCRFSALRQPPEMLARVEQPSLPLLTYRTYHPKYLRLSGHWSVLDDIVGDVVGGSSPRTDHEARAVNSGVTGYNCENRRFRTDTTKGKPHAPFSTTKGSVFDAPLYDNGSETLWLEYVKENRTGDAYFWFMWYDRSGRSTIRTSGVIREEAFPEVLKRLNQFGR